MEGISDELIKRQVKILSSILQFPRGEIPAAFSNLCQSTMLLINGFSTVSMIFSKKGVVLDDEILDIFESMYFSFCLIYFIIG